MNIPIIQTLRTLLSLLAVFLVATSICHGATMVLNAEGESNYANPDAWDIFAGGESTPAGRIPTAGDNAVINGGKSAFLDTDVGTGIPNIINIANQVPNEEDTSGTLRIEAGAVLETRRLILSANGSPATLTINGGTVSSGANQTLPLLFGSNEGTFNLVEGTYTDLASGTHNVVTGSGGNMYGTINISGGTFNSVAQSQTENLRLFASEINISGGVLNLTGGQVVPGAGTVLTVEGNDATILTDRLNVNNNAASFVFKFDADGISPFESAAFINLGAAAVTIDGSNYMGGSGEFPIFSAVNIATLPISEAITLVGWDGYDVSVVSVEEEGTVVSLNVVVTGDPQPSEWAGYAISDDGYVDTKGFLGWLWVSDLNDFVWLYDLQGWAFAPEENVSAEGAWIYLPNP